MLTIHHRLACLALVFSAAIASPYASLSAQDADLIVRNARIWTGDSTRPRAEALAVRGERLIAVGTNAQADAHRGARTRVIDAGGRFMTPGFIDDHTHFGQAGALLIGANLLDVHTPGPFAERVKAAVQRMSPGAWLTGGDCGAYEDNPTNRSSIP
jgi:predicted amidohydrolase YtcJ